MAITVYGSRLSSCTRRVLMMLTELNLDYTLSDIDLQKGEQKARTTVSLT